MAVRLLLFSILTSTMLTILLAQTETELVIIEDQDYLHKTDDRFLSIALDCGLIDHHWKTFKANDTGVILLAKALQPTVLRLGGTACDYMTFNTTLNFPPGESSKPHESGLKFSLTLPDWDQLVNLSRAANMTLLFDANVMERDPLNHWDPTNFVKFLDYNEAQNVSNLWFELGNEPNNYPGHFNKTITGAQLAQDFLTMRKIVKSRSFFNKSLIVGADVGNPYIPGLSLDPGTYIRDFFSAGHSYIDALTWHQYYLKGSTATVADFINPATLVKYEKQVAIVKDIIGEVLGYGVPFPVWMGETSSAYDSGAANISNTYVAGFLWLDKLGVAALNNYDIVIRQTFYDGWYSLISPNLQPYPDYFLSLLFKRLVGTRVLKVDRVLPDYYVRLYAHCTKEGGRYPPGAITLYALNLSPNATSFLNALKYPPATTADRYLLTPKNGNLQSTTVLLNGEPLTFTNQKLPDLNPVHVTTANMTVPPLTFGFYVIPDAKAPGCM